MICSCGSPSERRVRIWLCIFGSTPRDLCSRRPLRAVHARLSAEAKGKVSRRVSRRHQRALCKIVPTMGGIGERSLLSPIAFSDNCMIYRDLRQERATNLMACWHANCCISKGSSVLGPVNEVKSDQGLHANCIAARPSAPCCSRFSRADRAPWRKSAGVDGTGGATRHAARCLPQLALLGPDAAATVRLGAAAERCLLPPLRVLDPC